MSSIPDYQYDLEEIRARLTDQLGRKLGYPESLLGSLCSRSGQKLWVDFSSLGIAPGSLADLLIANVGDPFVDSATFALEAKDVERAVLLRLGAYFGIPEAEIAGYVTSGGTEGNLAALWWHRRALSNVSASEGGAAGSPIILVTTEDSSHYSLVKIADMLGLSILSIARRRQGEMNLEDFRAKLARLTRQSAPRGLIVVANLGSTFDGAFDPVHAIRAALDELPGGAVRYRVHGDGALMGILSPITRPLGTAIEHSLAGMGLDSLAISAHKWLGCPLVAGVVLTTKSRMSEVFRVDREVEYAGRIHDVTVTGCRPGLAPLQIDLTLKALGVGEVGGGKMPLLIESCRQMTARLYEELGCIEPPGELRHNPASFQLVIPRPSDALTKKYQLVPRNGEVAIHVLPNVDSRLMEAFIADLRSEKPAPVLALSRPLREVVRQQYELLVSKGFYVDVLRAHEVDEASKVLAKSFSTSEAVTVHLGMTEAEFRPYARAVCEAAAQESLSLTIKTPSDEIVACTILSDWLSRPPMLDELSNKRQPLMPILKALEESARCAVKCPLGRGQYVHSWMTAVLPAFHRIGLATLVKVLAAVRALHRGYEWLYAAFTSPYTHRTARQFHAATYVQTIKYAEFEYGGQRPFATLDGSVVAMIFRLRAAAELPQSLEVA